MSVSLFRDRSESLFRAVHLFLLRDSAQKLNDDFS